MKGEKAEVTINKEICPDSGSEIQWDGWLRVAVSHTWAGSLPGVPGGGWESRGAQAGAQSSSCSHKATSYGICCPDCSRLPTRI